QGKATKADLQLLQRLSNLLPKTSFCGLGQAAATALSTCLKNLRSEFEAHLTGNCPAGVCFTKQESGEQ
ncbi:MAG: NADH-quinone oxidoreductase subunit L, partial [Clostridia bacterium]|nr:NADH-quinone oxidoreductase subunit L [Clostridia bacterium]